MRNMAWLTNIQRETLDKMSRGPFLREESAEEAAYRSSIDLTKYREGTVQKLLDFKLAEIYEQTAEGTYKVRITEKGKKYLKRYVG